MKLRNHSLKPFEKGVRLVFAVLFVVLAAYFWDLGLLIASLLIAATVVIDWCPICWAKNCVIPHEHKRR